MNTHRCKLHLLGLIALSLTGCAAGQSANTITITGALTRRGTQMGAFWGVRDTSREGGKLWQLEVPSDEKSASITEQLTRFQQKTVRITGEAESDAANAASPFPVLRVLKIELVTP
jgi:hypothetical protein